MTLGLHSLQFYGSSSKDILEEAVIGGGTAHVLAVDPEFVIDVYPCPSVSRKLLLTDGTQMNTDLQPILTV
jgi:hypothetical protein